MHARVKLCAKLPRASKMRGAALSKHSKPTSDATTHVIKRADEAFRATLKRASAPSGSCGASGFRLRFVSAGASGGGAAGTFRVRAEYTAAAPSAAARSAASGASGLCGACPGSDRASLCTAPSALRRTALAGAGGHARQHPQAALGLSVQLGPPSAALCSPAPQGPATGSTMHNNAQARGGRTFGR